MEQFLGILDDFPHSLCLSLLFQFLIQGHSLGYVKHLTSLIVVKEAAIDYLVCLRH